MDGAGILGVKNKHETVDGIFFLNNIYQQKVFFPKGQKQHIAILIENPCDLRDKG